MRVFVWDARCKGLFLRDFVRRYVVLFLVSECCVLPGRGVSDKTSANSCQPEPRKCMNAVVEREREVGYGK